MEWVPKLLGYYMSCIIFFPAPLPLLPCHVPASSIPHPPCQTPRLPASPAHPSSTSTSLLPERKVFMGFMSKLLTQRSTGSTPPTVDSICLYIASQDETDIRAFLLPKRRVTRIIPTVPVSVDSNVRKRVSRLVAKTDNMRRLELGRHRPLHRTGS